MLRLIFMPSVEMYPRISETVRYGVRFVRGLVEEFRRHGGGVVRQCEQLGAPLSDVAVVVVENADHISCSHYFLLN